MARRNPQPTQTASFSRTASGYAVGGGIEMRLWAGLTAKVEYLHLDLGGATNTFVLAAGACGHHAHHGP